VGLWTLVGLGIGTLIRNQVGALLVAVVVAFLVEPLVSVGLHAADLDGVGQFLPSRASSAMTSPPTAYGELLPWWAGGLVLAGYALVFAALGVWLSVRRDVT
jgi:ABC-2 type transport system permease protein